MLQKSVVTLAFFSLLAGPSLAQAESVGRNPMEGKWVLDKGKSPSGKFAPGHFVQEIKTNGNEVTIESKYDEPKSGIYPLFWVGLMTNKLTLKTDGSEVLNQVGPYALVSKTTLEGNRMATQWTAKNDPGQVDGEWIRTLSDDGREMTMELKGKSSDGRTMDGKFVFVRR
ncbi:MAG TPA: hypothetical protein VE621_12020 [Bryobacteraceae bacterium]|nr:hypothetical protein [Bryobacteraceae bacterium]